MTPDVKNGFHCQAGPQFICSGQWCCMTALRTAHDVFILIDFDMSVLVVTHRMKVQTKGNVNKE